MSDLQVYEDAAERSVSAYQAFTRIYVLEHPLPVDVPWWRGLPWMMIPFGVISVAGIALSSLRTAPVFQEVALKIVGINLATAEAILALIVVDLFMVISRYQYIVMTGSQQETAVKEWILRGFWVAFTIAIGANLYASVGNLDILQSVKPALDLIIAIIVGLSAPVLSFISGDILGILWVQSDKYRKALRMDFELLMNQWHEAKERSWASQRGRYGAKIHIEKPVPLSLSHETNETRHTGYGFTRVSDGETQVFEYFKAHPEQIDFKVRELEVLIGVSKSTVSRARQKWYENASQDHRSSE